MDQKNWKPLLYRKTYRKLGSINVDKNMKIEIIFMLRRNFPDGGPLTVHEKRPQSARTESKEDGFFPNLHSLFTKQFL